MTAPAMTPGAEHALERMFERATGAETGRDTIEGSMLVIPQRSSLNVLVAALGPA